MTKRMTTGHHEAIRKRAEAATSGEWTSYNDDGEYTDMVYEYDRLTESTGAVIAECYYEADAEFIAEARVDIPALLAEVERLREIETQPKIIPLSKGHVTIVDADDFEKYSKHKWYSSHGYAKRSTYIDGREASEFLHRVIMGEPEGLVIDHINGNPLDNRKENLRACTHEQNFNNSGPFKRKTSSKYKGVIWHKSSKAWHARIGKDGIRHFLGKFDDEVEAARAYNEKAKEFFGEYAYQNDLDEGETQ